MQERYLLDEILDDVAGGHNVVSTVFIECGAMFKADGPEAIAMRRRDRVRERHRRHERVGELRQDPDRRRDHRHGRFAHWRRGGRCLDAHIAAGGGRFRGIRRGAFWHESPDIQNHRTNPPEGLLLRDDFRAGFKHLGPRKLSFEVWCAHTQLPDAISLARAFPDTTIVLDHFGGPIGIGPYAGKQDEVFATWKTQIDELARCPNVVAKLGGLNMEVNGYGWEHRPSAADQHRAGAGDAPLLRAHDRSLRRQALHVRVELPGRQAELQLYGAVEPRSSASAKATRPDERADLFYGTAARVYRL